MTTSKPAAATTATKSNRERNRQNMPTVAKFVDEYRKVFGPVTVKYASENGHTIGVREEVTESDS